MSNIINELDSNHQGRLEWMCRRGMLELDSILQNFLIWGYNNLSQSEKSVFRTLLEESDQNLLKWLVFAQKPHIKVYTHVIRKIRTAFKPEN